MTDAIGVSSWTTGMWQDWHERCSAGKALWRCAAATSTGCWPFSTLTSWFARTPRPWRRAARERFAERAHGQWGALAFSRGARFAQPALVNGAVGIILAPRGRLFRVLSFTFSRGKIVQIDVVAGPARLSELDLAVLAIADGDQGS